MHPNALTLEQMQIASGFVPITLTTARDGAWVSMKHYRRLAVVFFKGKGTAGDDPTISLQQARNTSADGAKNLTFETIYVKQDATSIGDVAQFTAVRRTGAGITHQYTHTDAAESEAIWVIEVKAEDLDIAGNFDCVRARISDVGTNAQLGCVLYLLGDPVYPAGVEHMQSAIDD